MPVSTNIYGPTIWTIKYNKLLSLEDTGVFTKLLPRFGVFSHVCYRVITFLHVARNRVTTTTDDNCARRKNTDAPRTDSRNL